MKVRRHSLESLFVSKVRLKALRFFCLNYHRTIHLRAAVREFDEEINAVRRELMRLESAKLLKTETKGNRKYFRINLEHPFTNDLISMFHQTYGLGGAIVENAKRLGDIDFAFLTPAYTKGFYYGDHIIDLVIVGVVHMDVLDELVSKYQTHEGREIHYTILKPSEYAIRKRRKDQFLFDSVVQDIVMLLGNHESLIR